MLSKFLRSVFGSRNDRLMKTMRQTLVRINGLESSYEALSSDALRQKTAEFRSRYQQNETLDNLLPESFALVREASKRVFNMRHFDVQMLGGMALHQGKIAEMGTGEGKTLMATTAAYLNALSGDGVHVVTVNDYLAKRDAEWMRPLYDALGMTVGIIVPNQSKEEKKHAYACDIVYATNNELGFDYLRDRMAYDADQQVQHRLGFAIVDEVDSILIDEARTPLNISGAAQDSSALYRFINDRLIPLLKSEDYTIDEKVKQAFLTEAGHLKVESTLAELGLLQAGHHLYDPENMALMHHVVAALRAHQLFKRDIDYLVADNQVVIVDEHTGRTMPGRRWSDGLHQAVEAKEKVTIQEENQTLASITFQNFFRLYKKLSGMTGTADTEAYEFHQIYGLEVVVIPTNRPCQRKDASDLIYLTQAEKFDAIISEIQDCVSRGQPVLVGTISIEASEHLSKLLTAKAIEHNVLNAKYHEQEARIVADAGRLGAVTIATNMAGRGTDIVLGGSLASMLSVANLTDAEKAEARAEWEKAHEAVIAAGGLHILGTERHESRRIDNQLRGRSGRQGDPGSSQFFLSLEDSLMRIFASDRIAGMMRKLGVEQGEAITHPWVTRAIENAQRKVEGHHFDIRKQLLQYDDVANEQRKVIYEQRDELLNESDVSETIMAAREAVVEAKLSRYMPADTVPDAWNIPELERSLEQEFGLSLSIDTWLKSNLNASSHEVGDIILEALNQAYQEKIALIDKGGLQRLEKSIVLHAIDFHWKEHLSALDSLRQSIHLRGYAQKDPKQEYKREAFVLFSHLLERIQHDVVGALARLQIKPAEEETQPIEAPQPAPTLTDDQAEMISRNEPCHCGSGRRYKHCHGVLV